MFKGLMGLGASFGGRKMAAFVERSDFWTGSDVASVAGVAAPISEGLVAGTLIATETGWQRVEDLNAGDRIVTFDNGMRPLRALGRGRLVSLGADLPRSARPLAVPEGAIGNRRALTLLPGQSVLIESDAGEQMYGDPFTLVPATALDGWNGIARVTPEAEIEVIFLDFDTDEIVYAEGMALVHCPRRQAQMVTTPDELILAGTPSRYTLLPPAQGRALVQAMRAA